MTSLATGLDTTAVPCLATIQNQVYYANGYNPIKVWDGIAASLVDAGMLGPVAVMGAPTSTAAGSCQLGVHGIRYRYCNSRTGYVSNPSLTTTVTIAAANNALTYNINTAATPIITSTDAKCDLILIEMTPVNSPTYYQVAQVANIAATSYVVSIADANLINGINSDALYGSVQNADIFSHEPPPYGQIMLAYKGRAWVLMPLAYALSTASFTNNNVNVTSLGTTFSQAWVGMAIKRGTDTTAYYIASGSGTALVLQVVYGGTTGAGAATVFSTTPNRGYYTRAFQPEEFYKSKYARDFLQGTGDILTSAIGRREAFYVFGRTCCERLIYTDDPSQTTSNLSPVEGFRGNFNQRTLIRAEGRLYAFDRLGIYIVGDIPEPISQPVDDSLRELVDYSQFTKFHGVFDPVERVLMVFFVATGDTQPKYAACMEIDTRRWFFHTYFQGITASTVTQSSDGQVRALLGDENGYSWFAGSNGSFDGVPPTNATVVTVGTGPTATVIPVTGTTLDIVTGLAGVILYDPATGLTGVVASNTSSVITLTAPGLTILPIVGASLYLGPIAFEYRSKWFVRPDQAASKQPIYLLIRMFPGSTTGTMRVYVYADFKTNPTIVTTIAGYDKPPDGTTITNGNGYIDINLSGGTDAAGFIKVPMQAQFTRAIQFRLTSVIPAGTLRIADVGLDMGGDLPNVTAPV